MVLSSCESIVVSYSSAIRSKNMNMSTIDATVPAIVLTGRRHPAFRMVHRVRYFVGNNPVRATETAGKPRLKER